MTKRKRCTATGKTRYRDRLAALLALATIHRRDSPRRDKTEQRVYHCPHCGSWHLTAQERRT